MEAATKELSLSSDSTPAALESVYHYAHDEFVQAAVALKKEIANKLKGIPPEHRIIAKQYASGKSIAQISRDLNRDERNTSRVLKTPKVSRIVEMLHHYELVLDGPMEMQRKNMLWRIAVNNEAKAPKTSVDALDKLNKMSNSYGSETGGATQISIVINNANLPMGALDQ